MIIFFFSLHANVECFQERKKVSSFGNALHSSSQNSLTTMSASVSPPTSGGVDPLQKMDPARRTSLHNIPLNRSQSSSGGNKGTWRRGTLTEGQSPPVIRTVSNDVLAQSASRQSPRKMTLGKHHVKDGEDAKKPESDSSAQSPPKTGAGGARSSGNSGNRNSNTNNNNNDAPGKEKKSVIKMLQKKAGEVTSRISQQSVSGDSSDDGGNDRFIPGRKSRHHSIGVPKKPLPIPESEDEQEDDEEDSFEHLENL